MQIIMMLRQKAMRLRYNITNQTIVKKLHCISHQNRPTTFDEQTIFR